MTNTRAEHWDQVYVQKQEHEVSWFQSEPALSLALIDRAGVTVDTRIVDVGGGASRLVDALLDRGFRDVSVLDVSSAALDTARRRLGSRGAAVAWLVEDVTRFVPSEQFGLWHDRAVFHFLTAEEDRLAYARAVASAVAPGGQVVVGTFAPDGPERCSGLPVVRYDAEALARSFGPELEPIESLRHEHVTPAGRVQPFTFVRFRRPLAGRST